MRQLPVLGLPAPVRGWPRRSRPRSRPKVRVAIVVAALFALALTGATSANSAAYAATEAPYGGTAAAVPGTVQAENYDTGGQGVAYNVTSVNGTANGYRSDGVDLEATTDTGGGDNLGWTAAGQWFKYTLNVATAGTYTVGLRIASPTAVTDALHIANSAGTNLSGNVTAPATGAYQTWTTVTASVTLPAGVADPDHKPGQPRLEHQLPHLHLDRRGRGGRPLRRDGGGGARHRAGGELRHRRAGRGLQRHLSQRHRQRLPLRRGRPGGHHRHRRRRQPGLDRGRAVVQVHPQRRDRGHVHSRAAHRVPHRGHRRPAHRQQRRHEPERQRHRPGHRRLPNLDHRHGQRHPSRRGRRP